MPALSFNVDHLRRLSLLIPANIEKDKVLMAQLKGVLLFCKIMELGVELYKCSIEDHLILLRRDMKRQKVFTMYGALPILRFLHASEHVTYSIYPLYPIERARVEGTIDIIFRRAPGTLQDCMEKNLLAIEPYLSISKP